MATLSDVAARAGVSVSAVSRVLSEAPSTRVSEATRQRIHDAARELGYRPNLVARALKSSRTHVVGLIIPELTSAIFAELMRGAEEEAQRADYMVLLARAEGAPVGEAIPRLIGEGRVDGVIVQVGDAMRRDDLEILRAGTLPVVFVNSIRADGAGSVTLDDALGTRIATQHLLDLGHRRIALLGGLATSFSGRRREEGFRAAMTDAGIAVPDEHVTRSGYDPRGSGAALAALAAGDPRPTAVVVANINAAHGALLEARRLGLRVPEDLSIVAIHDAWTAENTWPPLTTVRMPLYELGKAAMRAILDQIATGEVVDETVRVPPPKLIVRESTARIASA